MDSDDYDALMKEKNAHSRLMNHFEKDETLIEIYNEAPALYSYIRKYKNDLDT